MAAANPLEDLLLSDIDESAVSAMVGSLESRLASPTNKDLSHTLSETTVNNNHINNTPNTVACSSASLFNTVISTTQGPKGLQNLNNASQNRLSNAGVKPALQNTQIVTLNSVINSPSTVTCAGGSINVNSPISSHIDSKLTNSQVLLAQNVIKPTSVVSMTTNPSSLSYVNNPSNGTATSILQSNSNQVSHASSAIYNLASIAAKQEPLQVPLGGAQIIRTIVPDQQNLSPKPNQNIVKTEGGIISVKPEPTQYVMKQEPGSVQLKQEGQTIRTIHPGKTVMLSSNQPTHATNVHIVNAPGKQTTGTSSPGVISVRSQLPQQQVTVVRPQVMTTSAQQTGAPHMQVVNVGGPGQIPVMQGKTVQRLTGPIRIAQPHQQINIAPRPGVPNTITLPPGIQLPVGTMVMRNEQGNYVFVQTGQAGGLQQPNTSNIQGVTQKVQYVRPQTSVNQRPPTTQIVSIQQPQSMANQPHTVLRHTVPSSTPAHTTITLPTGSQQVVVRNVSSAMVQQPHPSSVHSHVTHPGAGPPANTPPVPHVQQQHILDNVKKCKNFLSTLIKLAGSQPPDTVKNVRQLIQGLIDGKVEPEIFTENLQVELKSSPQPYLVPFLKKSLPLLRQSLISKQMTIDGVRAPPVEILNSPQTTPNTSTAVPPSIQLVHRHPSMPKPIHRPLPTTQQQQIRPQGRYMHMSAQAPLVPNLAKPMSVNRMGMMSGVPTVVNAVPQTAPGVKSHEDLPGHKEKRKFEALKDDDDINDVATMGGVNLTEESRNILATNSELIGSQIRSCKDEQFLHHGPLMQRISAMARKHGIDDVSSNVINLVSHATQERLKDLVSRLSTLAEHRVEIYKINDKFEATGNVRAQIKFLEELDKLEMKRHGDQEREKLFRAAKSRSKHEDPEQLKLKQKAKQLQQAEMEIAAQKNANQTALAAIGPYKKRKVDKGESNSSTGLFGASQSSNTSATTTPNRTVMSRPRIKRVNLKDLIFLMEQDRTLHKSDRLYKTFLK